VEPLAWYRIAAPVLFVIGLGLLCTVRDFPRFRAMLLGIGLMVGYATVQDQVSVRLCPEYFTHFHNPIPGVSDPTLTGIAWGFLGAWWGGAILGYAAGTAATAGRKSPLPVRDLVRPMILVVVGIGIVVGICGTAVAIYSDMFEVQLSDATAGVVPAERRRALLVVASYHLAGYVAAVVGSIVLCLWVACERGRSGRSLA
jgi:hypothetical protein